jgi:hypothetical protein
MGVGIPGKADSMMGKADDMATGHMAEARHRSMLGTAAGMAGMAKRWSLPSELSLVLARVQVPHSALLRSS